ncbi:hypothetical protein POSPLADRAFT_1154155, partial [Postia placenta MAD-698-R-SB12]
PAPRRARKDAQHDRDRDRESAWGRSKLLSRLLTRDERDVAHVRTMLALTSERLAHETRRADDAEARIADVLHQFRAARETALHAQADAARAAEERSPPRATNTTVSVSMSDGSPIAAPSPIRPPSRPPAATPEPIPIQDPGRSRSRVRNEGPIVPVPVHNPVPSPSHPPVDVPPDNYIPYMSSDHIMALPPPHELARPVAPRSPSPGAARDDPGVRSRDDLGVRSRDDLGVRSRDDPGVRSRDFAYAHDAAPAQMQRAIPNAPFSPQSRTSTNISQYDLVSARNARSAASGGGGGGGGRDALAGLRQMIGAVRPQSRSERSRVRERERAAREDVSEPVRRERESSLERQRRSGAGTPLERLFKKRFRTRQSGSSGGVPDIMVESPTTATVSRTSTVAAANQPHLLSPEMHQQTLPPPADDADFSDPRPLPPLPEFYLTTPSAVGVSDASEQQLPAGFVPMSADDFPDDPAMQFASPKPLAGAKGPTYEVAPIPPGVVYPDPPGRRSATPGRRSATPGRRSTTPHAVALPPSPSSTPSPRRRRGSLSGHLSPLSLPLAFVASPSSPQCMVQVSEKIDTCPISAIDMKSMTKSV